MDFLAQFGDDGAVSVGAFTRRVKSVLERSIAPCWVRGEVSNFRAQGSGHLYFTLKDDEAQLPAVMFRGNASRLDFELRDGMSVSAFGEISVYEPHGRYQFMIRALVEEGAGRLHREFLRLKEKLRAEGLFDAERKRPLPALPRSMALVTSATGAAAQDFIRVLKRRGMRGRVAIIPAKVQGAGAAAEIVAGIAFAERCGLFDLLVVGRGGGSLEDLWPFNEEAVARAIAACELPVISAVGHEIDFTLADFAADIRAETPSAAAELISSRYLEMAERVEAGREELERAAEATLQELAADLSGLGYRLKAQSPLSRVRMGCLKLDDLSNQLAAISARRLAEAARSLAVGEAGLRTIRPIRIIEKNAAGLERLRSRLQALAKGGVLSARSRLEPLRAGFEAMNPESVLKRGYAMIVDADGRSIARAKDVPMSAAVSARFADGSVRLVRAPEKS